MMHQGDPYHHVVANRTKVLDRLISAFSLYLVPVSLVLFTLFVAFTLDARYPSVMGVQLAHGVGFLEGGLLTLAIFCLAAAVTNHSWTYVLLAAWLMGNLRLGAFALGWDTQWLGYTLAPEWMPFIRRITIGSYYLVTCTLFIRLFSNSLDNGRNRRLVSIAQWAGALLLTGALILPDNAFRILMWPVCILGAAIATLLLARVLYHTRSRVWLWHTALLGMAVSFMLSGILLASFGHSVLLDLLNGAIALLLPNVMVALAVGQRIRDERNEHIRAKTELITNYAITPIGTFTLGADNTLERANPVLEHMLDFCLSHSSTPIRWTNFFEPLDWGNLAQMTQAGQEVEIKLLDAAIRPGRPQHFVVRAATGNGRIEGSLQDITARTKTIRHLQLMADTDPLTEVLNRRGLEKGFAACVEGIGLGQPCALGYMDLDHFKRINGLFGHSAGDEVLKHVCQRIATLLTPGQHVGRIRGDEFIILFTNTALDQARATASKVIDDLQTRTIHTGGRIFQVKSAMGVVELDMSMTPKSAISAASQACRDARKQHLPVVVYRQGSPELQAHSEELRLFAQIEPGKPPPGLYLEMQPIMSLQRPLQSLNLEVLLRVRDSTGIPIPAGRLIAAAEENGTVTIIDKWVFMTTLQWLALHENQLAKTRFISVNMSGISLNDDKFIDDFFSMLANFEHVVNRLCVEITEGVALQNMERTRSFMKRLQDMGGRIALDDFGAGYTSFSYLKELSADAIKIDGALIKDMLATETNIAVVRTIVELARNLGMKSIAEWVEDAATLQALQEMGVDYAQGWAISQARSSKEILNAQDLGDLMVDPEILDLAHSFASRKYDTNHWDMPGKLAPIDWF